MKRKYFHYTIMVLVMMSAVACKEDEYALPQPKKGLQNDCIKRTIGPNLVGLNIEFAYAMALLPEEGNLVSARVEASIPGAAGTKLENNAYYTNGSGIDVPVLIGEPSINTDNVTEVIFSRDTSAVTLRYFYVVPEEARGQTVSFTFSTTDSNGRTAQYKMGPYTIAKMDFVLDRVVSDNNNCYISIADMAVYNATDAALNADKIDLVYLHRVIAGKTFDHSLVAPAAEAQYLPGITLPAGVSRSAKLRKAWNLRDFHLARSQFGVYIDDIDFEELDIANAPNYAINMKAEAGLWVETADGKYRAYIYVNSVNAGAKTMTISIKRYPLN